jgi:hypothetical protein
MAETVTCTGCGGVVPMTALAAAVACPYCRRQIHLSPDDLAQLAAYRAHVEGQLARAREQQTYAEGWNRWYGAPDAKKKHSPLIPLALWLGMIVLLVVVTSAAQALGFAAGAAKILPFAMLLLMFVFIGGYMFWFYRGRTASTRTTQLAAANVHCPSCGAPHQLHPGEVLTRCRFCSAPLMPDDRVMDHGRAEVDRALLTAELERGRAERRGMTMMSSSSLAKYQAYIVVGSFLPVTCLSALAFTVSWLTGDGEANLGGVLLVWLLASANAGVLALVYLYRRHRRESYMAVQRALAARFGGHALPDPWAMNAWFDRHWAGLVPFSELFPGPYFLGTALVIDGYPVLVVMNPVGAADQYKGFLTVRVSGWLTDPARAPSHPAIGTAKRSLHVLGGSLETTRAGLYLRFPQKAARRVAKLESVNALGDVMASLANAARQLNAQPVDIP